MGTDGDELIELDRIDNSSHSPLHEQDAGHYGFWLTTSKWVDVLDFSLSEPLIYPYTWSTVIWEPNTAKDWPGGYSYVPPSELPIGDLLAQTIEGMPVTSQAFIAETFGNQFSDVVAYFLGAPFIARRYDFGVPA